MSELWNQEAEKRFFEQTTTFASQEQLFYVTNENKYLAYWPKKYKGKKSTLQSRNTLIGKFTEKWTKDLIQRCINEKNLFAIQGAVCKEIELPSNSSADVVISKKNGKEQNSNDIIAIFEVKMSIVWNWEFDNGKLTCIGDYNTHKGTPGMLRSDSMLKAIGKSVNIRTSGFKSTSIPIIVIGNTPITKSYYKKVDSLKKAGIVQGFWSVNPNPLDSNNETIKHTTEKGFLRFDNFEDIKKAVFDLIDTDFNFFSGVMSKSELGKYIEMANKEATFEKKGEAFLSLIRENK